MVNEKNNLKAELAVLSESMELLEEDNQRLQSELDEKKKMLAESETAFLALEEKMRIAEESQTTILEEMALVEESLLEEQKKKELFVFKNLVRVKDIDASVVVIGSRSGMPTGRNPYRRSSGLWFRIPSMWLTLPRVQYITEEHRWISL